MAKLLGFSESVGDFRRGLRHARTVGPAPQATVVEHPSSWLEDYFDAHTVGPGLWKWRHYFEIYERHLSRFRGRPTHFLEVGIFGGGSLSMWSEYFGPECTIYGVDIDPACRAYETDRVKIFIGDQSDPSFWASVLARIPTLDAVLDDGGHQAHQQIATLEALLPRVRHGGAYLCEDVHGPSHAFHSYIDGLTRPLHDIGLPTGTNRFTANALQRQIAAVHRYPIMTVLEKTRAPVDHFEAPRRGTEWPASPG